MLDEILNRLRPASGRQALQAEAGIHNVPPKELCTAIYTTPTGEKVTVDLLCIDQDERNAIIVVKKGNDGAIALRSRDQAGAPDTWLWTKRQMEAAQRRSKRIRARINQANRPIEMKPLFADRRLEILTIGCYEGYPDEIIIERLQAEGLDTTLPENYRTTWNPFEQQTANTEPLLDAIKPPEQI